MIHLRAINRPRGHPRFRIALLARGSCAAGGVETISSPVDAEFSFQKSHPSGNFRKLDTNGPRWTVRGADSADSASPPTASVNP